ncbi:unnamed protein product [Camellia sinensis]
MKNREIHSSNSLLFGFPEKDCKIKIIRLPSRVRDFNLVPPFPPSPSQSKDEAKSEEEVEAEKFEKAVDAGAKSPTLNEQVSDLTQDEEDKVSKDAAPKKTTSDAPTAEKSINQTLQKIDAELAVEKAAEKSSQMSSEPQTGPADNAE